MLKAAQYLVVAAAFFLPWTIGMMIHAFQAKNRKSLLAAALLCSLDILVITGALVLAVWLQK